MPQDNKKKRDKFVGFRVGENQVQTLDSLAKLSGTNRSTVLRRLIPDLTPKASKVCTA